MELTKYLATGRACKAQLSNDEELGFEFSPSLMTGSLMDSISSERDKLLVPAYKDDETPAQTKKREEAEASYYTRYHQILARQLAKLVTDLDITVDGQKPPMGTPDEREAILHQLAFKDLKAIDEAIVEAIRGPLAPGSTA